MLLSTTTKGQLTDVFSKLLLDFELRKKIYGICKHTTIAFIEFFIARVRTNILIKYSRVINRKLSGIVYSWKNDYRGGILSTRCRTIVLQNKKTYIQRWNAIISTLRKAKTRHNCETCHNRCVTLWPIPAILLYTHLQNRKEKTINFP